MPSANDIAGRYAEPGQVRDLESTATTADIDITTSIQSLRRSLIQFDLLIGHFLPTHSDLVEGYHINSAVVNLPVRHSGIEGIVRDDRTTNPLAGATIKLLNTNKQATSDLLGHYAIIRVRTGDYQFDVSKPGCRTVTGVVSVG